KHRFIVTMSTAKCKEKNYLATLCNIWYYQVIFGNMKIPLSYTISHNIVSLLTKIEANKVLFQALSIPGTLFQNLTHQSLLKSSVFSAQIEGNPLNMDSFE